MEERETLKSYSHGFPSENGYALSIVSNCDTEIAETRRQSRSINNEKSGLMSIQLENSSTSSFPWDYASLLSSNAASKSLNLTVHTVTQSSPSPVLSCVENAPQDSHVSRIITVDSNNGCSESNSESLLSKTKTLQDVHISGRLMEEFLELARDNTKDDLETCGVLGAFLERGTFYVTTLIIPKQESTSSTCQAISEEEIFAIQNERSLFPVGWIHTHPSQSCFMSSVDLHTQYSYQVMVAEAFAIVMAPTDTTRSSGIFRLSDPGGMSISNECQERGFHSHEELPNGSPIYEECSNVYINSNIRFEIFDLR